MKRGPKGLFTPQLQKEVCESVEQGNTFKTACEAHGIGERTLYDWMKRYPAFAAAVYVSRSRAKAKLVRVIVKQAPRDWRAAAWILERSWPNEYARTERIEQIGEQADDKKISVAIYYDTQGQPLSQLLDFPIHPSMAGQQTDSPKTGRKKQQRLLGERVEAAAQPEPEPEKISDAPPPKVVHPALTGRIRPEWKGNGK